MLRDVGDGFVSRWLSSLFVMGYIIAAFVADGAVTGLRVAAYCLVAWCCVWFPGAMGIPPVRTIGREAREAPARMVWVVGWGLLLIPIGVWFLLWVQGVNPVTMDWRTR
jgi:hypothetical protein